MKNIEEIEKLLINVDMINGFINVGPMADKTIANIIPEQIRLIEMITREEDGIAFVKDSHTENCREYDHYPKHCLAKSYESELVDELKEYEASAYVYLKNSTSAIFNERFLKDIKAMRSLKEVIITGCCTDICILNLAIPLQNYFDEYNIRIMITVPINCVETYNSDEHNRTEYNQMAFKLMKQAGINIIDNYESED